MAEESEQHKTRVGRSEREIERGRDECVSVCVRERERERAGETCVFLAEVSYRGWLDGADFHIGVWLGGMTAEFEQNKTRFEG